MNSNKARIRYFNSQPHKEADRNGHTEGIFQMDFNSQPHKEADVRRLAIFLQNVYFNSQPHKEADD